MKAVAKKGAADQRKMVDLQMTTRQREMTAGEREMTTRQREKTAGERASF